LRPATAGGNEALGGPLRDGEGDPARLDLGVEALVLQQRGRAGLEEDLGALLLDHLVVLGRGGGHRQFERRLRRESGAVIRSPALSGTSGAATRPLMASAAVSLIASMRLSSFGRVYPT
jgi:hypothetical protein